ncbi:hypothetical protein CEXT_796981 [Caerostris extrusa]|uniref:Uncharacterized protein n=1 Tax=Caerostris extrusa TaxID=172846 RepID=A0AAV4QAJ8_CAEEX|nr:hypothetical protein CEXT_796981 [Caerostris extrusa]
MQPENTPFKNKRMYGLIAQRQHTKTHCIGVEKECIDASCDYERTDPSIEAGRFTMHPRKGGLEELTVNREPSGDLKPSNIFLI